MDHNDCCCFCFSARTGVMIIGALLWIGFVFEAIFFGLLTAAAVDSENPIPFQDIPNLVISLILGIYFCCVVGNENKENDWATRIKFAKVFLWLAVIVDAILQCVGFSIAWIVTVTICEDNGGSSEECNAVMFAFIPPFVIGLLINIGFGLYFHHVCKLYAAQADPAYITSREVPKSAPAGAAGQHYQQMPMQPGQPQMYGQPQMMYGQPGQPQMMQPGMQPQMMQPGMMQPGMMQPGQQQMYGQPQMM